MKSLFAIHANSFIFNLKPNENLYEILLRKFGRGAHIKKLVATYRKNYKSGPLLLKDVVSLFAGVKNSKFKAECKKLSKSRMRKEFLEFLRLLKSGGHKIAILSSYPAELFRKTGADYVIATELESKNKILTGKYLPIKISAKTLQELRKISPKIAKEFIKSKGEPNRFGLAAKLFEILQKEKFNKVFILGDSIKAAPLLEMLKS